MFQPSEAVKLGMIIYFASIYTKKQEYIDHFGKGILPPLLILGFVCLLILKQPDLGTATSVLLTCGMILLCSGARRLHLFMLAGVAGLSFVYFAFSETYRLKRILSFLDPFQDPQGDGYQLINSYFAIALGGIKGNGLGESIQKLGYLSGSTYGFYYGDHDRGAWHFGVTAHSDIIFFNHVPRDPYFH